ncbi:hypothetical protein BDA96_09G107200 [Sorghum bicolor]|uniref:Uncharacterized protein n=2 Tax=Sorghum bicolor TaxID=4558 RepID=A0A921Q9K1_SORBI|nr:hypothetical protein BDA96_09G107200 [Sorghum bicolor]OQU77789.1 hypothetical protein SORBI_3009G103101 [Sorghum bicolor]
MTHSCLVFSLLTDPCLAAWQALCPRSVPLECLARWDLGSLDATASCGNNSAELQWLLEKAVKERVHIVVLKARGWRLAFIFPKIHVMDPYKRLRISKEASEDEF